MGPFGRINSETKEEPKQNNNKRDPGQSEIGRKKHECETESVDKIMLISGNFD